MLEHTPQPNLTPIYPNLCCPTCHWRLIFHLTYMYHMAAILAQLNYQEPMTPYLEHFLTHFYAQLNVYHDLTCQCS